jgi:hypothetical protein
MRTMGPSPASRAATAASLLALLGALSTGLPSHHHGRAHEADASHGLLSADHHAHGSELVDQDERAPAAPILFVVPPAAGLASMPPPASPQDPPGGELPAARQRAPPPGAPRAPPRSA